MSSKTNYGSLLLNSNLHMLIQNGGLWRRMQSWVTHKRSKIARSQFNRCKLNTEKKNSNNGQSSENVNTSFQTTIIYSAKLRREL